MVGRRRPRIAGIVPSMDDARSPDPSVSGPLTREAAQAHLERGSTLMEAGEFERAAVHFNRVIGFDDPQVTAAGLLGLGEARYRMDDEGGALASWTAVTQLPETAFTYPAWRNIAAARVRDGDLTGAIDAYREADRRAPAEDKAEIATRLGWLSKETGDAGASRRYFAKGRGDGPLVPMATVILAATVIVSMTVFLSTEGQTLQAFLWLDKAGVALGEYWRLWTVTLVHGDLLHLFFNMYALFLAGPVVERWYGSIRFVVFYLTCAAAVRSRASSSAAVTTRWARPARSSACSGSCWRPDGSTIRSIGRAAASSSNSGVLILINIVFGLASAGQIDNAAHLGGLAAGLWLGAMLRPTKVATMSSGWTIPGRSPATAGTADGAMVNPTREGTARLLMPFVLAVVVVVLVAGIALGTAVRSDDPGRQTAVTTYSSPNAT